MLWAATYEIPWVKHVVNLCLASRISMVSFMRVQDDLLRHDLGLAETLLQLLKWLKYKENDEITSPDWFEEFSLLDEFDQVVLTTALNNITGLMTKNSDFFMSIGAGYA